mgnify:CR=1 FL=1
MTRAATHRRFSLDSPPLVLDGGFSTQCEALGADLSIGKLWSARLINDDPDLVAREQAEAHDRYALDDRLARDGDDLVKQAQPSSL